ncbi:MAG TPA: methyltransferase domain-containing protein [Thermoanaerobaculia bacterium]|jgi:2-polyprenyl-3-methyl-5-hydroxy-6-metoxy-1,4-benzoquinol methylase
MAGSMIRLRSAAARFNPARLARRLRRRFALDRELRAHAQGRAVPSAAPALEFPRDEAELRKTKFFRDWWYYDVELMPGVIAKGIYASDSPMLPRLHLRDCDLRGASCLDIGTMEGLIPVVMKRGGAADVVAVDAVDHCAEKMAAVRHYYDVDFEFRSVGLMYDLYKKLPGRAFDLINCSGLLYHVVSPLHVLMGLRPLLKRNGLLIVSTPVVNEEGFRMSFNNAGRIQREVNTFWYVTVRLLDYMLRYLKLAPIAARYYALESLNPHARLLFDERAGYLSVVCRAVGEVRPEPDDEWMVDSALHSWEYRGLADWDLADSQPKSSIAFRRPPERALWNERTDTLDLWKAVNEGAPTPLSDAPGENHTLRLSDRF